MSTVVLPAVARAALRTTAPSAELVFRRGGRPHLYAGTLAGLRDFTLSGALRSPYRPVCEQKARRWYLAEPDGSTLCSRCAAWARAHLELDRAPVTLDEILDVLDDSTCVADVDAAQTAAIAGGLVARRVRCPGRGVVPLHTLLRVARNRLTASPRVGVVESNWLERVDRSRRPHAPRRIA